MRKRSYEVFSPAEERAAIECEALDGLHDGATDEYMKQLEERVAQAKTHLADAVERGKRMRWVLESRKAALRGAPISRPETASTTMAPSSRPGSTAPSRPASAGPPVCLRR